MVGPDFKETFFHCKFRVVYVLKLFILIIYNLIDTYKNNENIKESIINFLAESSQCISLTLVENTFITSYSGKVTKYLEQNAIIYYHPACIQKCLSNHNPLKEI